MSGRSQLTCSGVRSVAAVVIPAVLLLIGCRSTPRAWTDSRPLSHSVRAGDFVIRSDFMIAEDAPMIQELEQLQVDITKTLELPAPRDQVVVYLFSGESAYRRYMRKTWPDLPARRAYFIGTSRELSVYSFHGPRVEEDLRHELTHGLLHATLGTVPLWLDEGLAEYFEVRGDVPGAPHPEHVRTLQRSARKNWNPSIERLEEIVDFQKFGRQDYAESWGWVHFLLHDNPDGKQVLLGYLGDLREAKDVGSFQARLPANSHKLAAYVAHLKRTPGPSFLRL
jgi:hypothetical protein